MDKAKFVVGCAASFGVASTLGHVFGASRGPRALMPTSSPFSRLATRSSPHLAVVEVPAVSILSANYISEAVSRASRMVKKPP